jgi:DNA-binding PadR family transcriptional regulator
MERELLLLGLLRQTDMHGYQLHEFIHRNMASCVDLKKATAYYLLDKMTESGWLIPTEEQEGGRPPRRVYQLTEAGESAYQAMLRENLSTHYEARFTGDIGFVFLDSLPAEEAVNLLSHRRTALQAELDAAQTVPPHVGTSQLVIEHLVRHLRTELDWLDEVIRRIEPRSEQENT